MIIEELNVKNSFCHLNTTVVFSDGVNYLTGKNECGKSELLDMIAYGLYGTVALRGAADTYKELSVTLRFNINSRLYKVVREKTDILYKIHPDGTEEKLVTSKTAVNNHIISLLGYNYDIFIKTNFCKQSDSELFNRMSKGDRLKFIDKISGIEEAKGFEKFLDDTKKDINSELKGVSYSQGVLDTNEFVEDPELEAIGPNGVDEVLTPNLKELYTLSKTYADIDSVYSLVKSSRPTKEEAEAYDNAYHLAGNYDRKADEATNGRFKKFNEWQRHLKDEVQKLTNRFARIKSVVESALEVPYTKEDVEVNQSILDNNKLFAEKQRLLSSGHIECPECTASFPLMNKELKGYAGIEYIEPLYADLKLHAKYKNWYDSGADVQLINDQNLLETEYYTVLKDLEKDIDSIGSTWYHNYHVQIDGFSYKSNNHSKLYKTVIEKAKSAGLIGDHAYASEYLDILESISTTELPALEQAITDVSALKEKLIAYFNHKTYVITKLAAMKAIEEFSKGKKLELELIGDLHAKSKKEKLSIQSNYIPSLNRQASTIVNQMTGGERFSLTISDTFDLLLDGKDIGLYSGSAKVIGNVAFRTAIIELFYKKSFPLFIGDEVDSFMDPDRAAELKACFDELSKEGYQILLISHHTQEDGNIINVNELKNANKIKV